MAISQQQQKLQSLRDLLHNWVNWLYTRKFYAAPVPQNILARMIEQNTPKSGEPPNARNDALCCAWNLVIENAQKNALSGNDDDFLPFMYTYVKECRPVDHNNKPVMSKALADILAMDRSTIHRRAQSGATKYYNQALYLQELNSQLQCEVDGYTSMDID